MFPSAAATTGQSLPPETEKWALAMCKVTNIPPTGLGAKNGAPANGQDGVRPQANGALQAKELQQGEDDEIKAPEVHEDPIVVVKQKLQTLATRRQAVLTGIGEALDNGAITTVEDLFKIPDPAKRTEKAKKVEAALNPIPALNTDYKAIFDETTKLVKDGGKNPDKEITDLHLKVLHDQNEINNNLPDSFIQISQSEGKIKSALAPFTNPDATPDKKRLTEAKGEQSVKEAKDSGEKLAGAIGKYQVRGVNQANSFFDSARITVAMSDTDAKAAAEATAKIAEKGRAILYNGGSYDDLKDFMKNAGIAEQWWPPELVDSVQAWRKTQRAVREENVQTAGKENAGGLKAAAEGFLDVAGSDGAEYVKSNFELTATSFAEDSESLQKTADEWASGLLSGLKAIPGAVEFLKGGVEVGSQIKEDGAKKLGELLEKSAKTLTAGASAAGDAMSLAAAISKPVKDELKKVIPGLSIATSGAELLMALNELRGTVAKHAKTGGLEKQAAAGVAQGSVDEATMGALSNALTAEKVQIGKGSMDVVGKAGETASAIATTAGGAHGAAVGAAISVIGNAIMVGSNIAFRAIDWSSAKEAQETIRQAQAGNMVAQVKVFEDSGFYAKMYICLLCKDNNPLAKKFVVDRGIVEEDLDKVMGLKILREQLLKADGQVDDTKVEGNIVKYALGVVGQAGAAAASSIADAAKQTGHAARSLVTKPYDASWNAGEAKLDAQTWEATKKAAIEAGLINDSTGIGAVLAKAKALGQLAKLPQDKAEAKKVLTDAVAQLREVRQAFAAYSPEAYMGRTPVPHAGMVDFVQRMIALTNTTETDCWDKMTALGLHDPNWTPPALAEIKAGPWKALWKDGVEKANLPAGDQGVGTALTTVEAQDAAWDKLKDAKDKGQEQRKQVLTLLQALDDVKSALMKCLELPEVNQSAEKGKSSKLTGVINNFMLMINGRERELDQRLSGLGADGAAAWKAPALDLSKPLAAAWKTLNDAAVKDGYCNPDLGDAGLGEALASFDKSLGAIGKDADPQKELAAYARIEELAGRIKLAANDFGRVNRFAAEALKDAAVKVAEEAVRQSKAKVATKPIKTFKPAATFDAKGWKETYGAAIEAGALLESDTALKGLAEKLEYQESAKEKYEKAKQDKKPKEIRATAEEYMEALKGTMEIVGMISELKDYGKHRVMGPYLNGIKSAAATARKDPEGDAEGVSSSFKAEMAKGLDAGEWDKNKRAAVAGGIIPDKKTGVTKALETYMSAVKDLQGAKGDDIKARREKLRGPVLADLSAKLTETRALSKNEGWTGYVDWLLADCKRAQSN